MIADDFKKIVADTNPELNEDEVTQIFDNVRLAGAESDFATLHKVYDWMIDGIKFTMRDGLSKMISLIDFENPNNNVFPVVNQFTVEYTNNGQKELKPMPFMAMVSSVGSNIVFHAIPK